MLPRSRNLTLRVTWSSRSHLKATELSFAEMPGIIAPGEKKRTGTTDWHVICMYRFAHTPCSGAPSARAGDFDKLTTL